jgi:thiamine kinase-like enzyme
LKIPERPDEITPAWITRAFADRHPGAHATAVEIVDAHSGTTGRARLRVAWAGGSDGSGGSGEGSTGAPSAIFAKLAPSDPLQRQMVLSTGMGRREARFYAELGREMPVRVATPYWTGWSEDGNAYLMLLEDLAGSGCRFPGWKDPELADYARGTMQALARLHARFQGSPRFESDLSWIEPPMRSEFGPLMVKSALEQFGAEMPPAFHEMARIYTGHHDLLNARLDRGAHTLVHGDSHLGNLFVDGERIGLLDWACVSRAPGLRDVAYFLCSSIPTELRRSQERPLLELYLRGLAEPPSFDEAWLQYRLYSVCAWIAATVTAAAGSRMQPLEVGQRSMQRATDALIDLGTPRLVREELGLA